MSPANDIFFHPPHPRPLPPFDFAQGRRGERGKTPSPQPSPLKGEGAESFPPNSHLSSPLEGEDLGEGFPDNVKGSGLRSLASHRDAG
jgi:hypothetical protein